MGDQCNWNDRVKKDNRETLRGVGRFHDMMGLVRAGGSSAVSKSLYETGSQKWFFEKHFQHPESTSIN